MMQSIDTVIIFSHRRFFREVIEAHRFIGRFGPREVAAELLQEALKVAQTTVRDWRSSSGRGREFESHPGHQSIQKLGGAIVEVTKCCKRRVSAGLAVGIALRIKKLKREKDLPSSTALRL